MSATDTKQRILDVAEQMFADNGFAGSSLRRIIAAAGVNLAAVHYHFRSKEALLESVLLRRLEPLNRERLRLLDECEASAGKKGPSIEAILTAFIGPPMRLILHPSGQGRQFGKLIARLHTETGEFFTAIVKRHFSEIVDRFGAALSRACPDLPPGEQYWRMHCAIALMAHTMASWDQLQAISNGLLKLGDVETAVPRIVNFLVAGFNAPVEGASKARAAKPSRKHAISRGRVHREKFS